MDDKCRQEDANRDHPTPYRDHAAAVSADTGHRTYQAKTRFGERTLDDYLNDLRSFAQDFIVVYRGQIVYETYPGMRPGDAHLWASTAKPLASLIIDKLIDQGLLDERKTFGTYMPDFRGAAWESITIKDILDMTTGLNAEENAKSRSDPNSITTRLFDAELGEPNPTTGKMETVREILKDAKPVRPAGTSFDYGSPITQALVLLAEDVSGKTFADLFDERVWSKVGPDGPLQLHLASDGTAAVHGFVSSSLRDMARFGMLYTPSWNKVAAERVVTPEIIERIRKGVRPNAFYMAGVEGPILTDGLNDTILSNSRQWDAVFPDGDFYKSGFMAQGLYVSHDRDLVIAISQPPSIIPRHSGSSARLQPLGFSAGDAASTRCRKSANDPGLKIWAEGCYR